MFAKLTRIHSAVWTSTLFSGKLVKVEKRVFQIAAVATALLFLGGMSSKANADIVQISNSSADAYYYSITGFSGVVDARYHDMTPGYDEGYDLELDTSISPTPDKMVLFSKLDGHYVDVNFTTEPHIGEIYTFYLGFENDSRTTYSSLENHLALNDFVIDNSNGVTDYAYTLSVNTSGTGSTYDYTRYGLLSTKVNSQSIARWDQDIPSTMDWSQGSHYGILTITAVDSKVVWYGDVAPTNPTTWNTSMNAYIGKTDDGILNISNGGEVSNHEGHIGYASGSTGKVTVDGAGSTWINRSSLYVGYNGSGTLSINGGGTLQNANGFIGYNSGSTGVVTVDGASSTWTSGRLDVGISGHGMLNITGGGAVSSSGMSHIGYFSHSDGLVTVDGAGSTWTSSNELFVGSNGSGTLNIIDGGVFISNSLVSIGSNPGSTGMVTVDGAGSTFTDSNWTNCLVVGSIGSGTLNITGGGAVSSSGRV